MDTSVIQSICFNRYPPFPEAIAFGKDSRKRGIACHHPKLLVSQRENSIRVIITSANLVAKQVITKLKILLFMFCEVFIAMSDVGPYYKSSAVWVFNKYDKEYECLCVCWTAISEISVVVQGSQYFENLLLQTSFGEGFISALSGPIESSTGLLIIFVLYMLVCFAD